MAGLSGTNYRENYFEYPTLTIINGEPTSESLHKARNKLKANALLVYSNLGDGMHGHLALVISIAKYSALYSTPFERPIHPGILTNPPTTSAALSMEQRDKDAEQLCLFREVQGVKKALKQQLVAAVDPTYLSSLRSRTTNALQGTVSDILDHLQEVYGTVSPQMIEDRDAELRSMIYNPRLPIDVVFNAVEDLVDFAALGKQPFTAS